MLSFTLRVGDDVYFGADGAPLEEYQQLVLKEARNGHLTVLTPEESIDIPVDGQMVDSGIMDVGLRVWPDAVDKGLFTLSMEAHRSVRILRGRVYRRELQ